MAYKIRLSNDALIDALEEKLKNVYENIGEDDSITRIELDRYGVTITIGEEEEET